MKRTIVKSDVYSICISLEKNRLYLSLFGFWMSPSVAPNYLEDICSAIKFLRPPFTVLADLREMKTPGHLVKNLHIEAQKIAVQSGAAKSAEVIPDRISIELELQDYATDSLLHRRSFRDRAKAETWLDKV